MAEIILGDSQAILFLEKIEGDSDISESKGKDKLERDRLFGISWLSLCK